MLVTLAPKVDKGGNWVSLFTDLNSEKLEEVVFNLS